MQMQNEVDQVLQLIGFTVGEERFAIDISEVHEINRFEHINRIPDLPDHVLGVIDLRGIVIPVINLAEKLGIKYQRDSLGYRILVKVLERIADHIENIAKNYILLTEIQKQPQLDEYISLVNSTAMTFEKSFRALFERDGEAAEKIFQELKKIENDHSDISKKLFKIENIQSAIYQKTMLDSLGRIASYSGDIAEIAINMSTEVP